LIKPYQFAAVCKEHWVGQDNNGFGTSVRDGANHKVKFSRLACVLHNYRHAKAACKRLRSLHSDDFTGIGGIAKDGDFGKRGHQFAQQL
jgi:hypothetical protein